MDANEFIKNAESEIKAREDIENFIKEAFKVDGDVTAYGEGCFSMEGLTIRTLIECEDSKRGTFYIGLVERDA
jgi:hypothetical protein